MLIIFSQDGGHDHNINEDLNAGGGAQDPASNTVSGTAAVTGDTLSTEDSATDDEVQSTPSSQDGPPKPYPGMLFNSWQDAKLHYNRYAKHVGFSIKSSTSRRSNVDKLTDKYLF